MFPQQWTVDKPYLKINGGLLEGPYYNATSNQLRFVDIEQEKLYTVDLDQGPSSLRCVETTDAIGVTAEIEGDEKNLIVGAKYGIARLDPETGKLDYLRKVWNEQDGSDKPRLMRLNDGACDPAGRFWVGAMNDPKVKEPVKEGVLFRLDPDLSLHRVKEHVSIPNGIGWTDGHDTMYWTDSPEHSIYAFDYDLSSGNVSNQRVIWHDGSLTPDGFAIDEEGCIWSALWGDSKVVRISPSDGKVIGQVHLPTRHVTCPVFVGTELFITTARDDDTHNHPGSAELSGCIYRVDVGVRGQGRGKGNGKYKFKLAK